MYLIDIAAFNAFTVHQIKYPSEYKNQSNRERLNSLDNLCQELLDPSIKIRSEKFSLKRNGCQKSLQESFKLAGHALSNILSPARNSSPISSPKPKRSYCFFCQRKENSTRYTDRCTKCDSSVCREHSMLYCINCK
jgi:hypothetical protein